MSKTFCAMPWTHLHVGVSGQVHLCCVSKAVGSINRNSLEEIWNSDTLKRVRNELLSDKKPKECQNCFYREDELHSTSFRTEMNENFSKYADTTKTLPDGTLPEMKLFYIDFRFNNLCNFKCRMCSPMYSSSIGSELAIATNSKNIKILKNPGPVLYEEIKKQYNNIKKIYFAGGEPVMQHEHFQVLQDLINLNKADEISLIYNTNGSKFKSGMGDMFEYWKKFKQVDIIFSIDGYGKPAEYWRSGTKWEDIEANIRQANINSSNINVNIHSVVGWPNIFNWIEFIQYAIDTNLIDNLVDVINISILENPVCYSLSVVPEFKKNIIHDELNNLKTYILNYSATDQNRLLKGIDMLIYSLHALPRLGHNTLNREEFMYNTMLDEWRNEDFFTAFPEHEDMRQYIT